MESLDDKYTLTPVRIEYHLTQKGRKLRPILERMALFSLKYCYDQIFEKTDPVKINKITARSFGKNDA
jgi:DNA-binding HxlR family transcriptional regulator